MAQSNVVPFREPTTGIETITPKQAESLLARAADVGFRNRPIKRAHVSRIASDIAGGRWQLNGDPIRIDGDGVPFDGQHRLTACIEAQKPIVSVVIRGISRDTMDTIDGNIVRKNSDRLFLKYGVNNVHATTATLHMICLIKRGFNATSRVIAFHEVEDALHEHGAAVEWALRVIPHIIDPGLPSGGASVRGPFALMMPMGRQELEDFAARYASGACSNGDPEHALRRAVAKSNNYGGVQRHILATRALRAMEARLAGEKIHHLKVDSGVVGRVLSALEK